MTFYTHFGSFNKKMVENSFRVCPFDGVALVGTLKTPLPRWDFDFYKRKLPTADIIFRVKITGGILVGGILSKLFFKVVFS